MNKTETMERIKRAYRLSDLSGIKAAADVLKGCPALKHQTCLTLHRVGKILGPVLENHAEEVEVIRQKFIEDKKASSGEQNDSQLKFSQQEVAQLNREINKLEDAPIEVDLPVLLHKDFPEDPKTLGMRKVSRQDAVGKVFEVEIYYYDHYLALVGTLIDDEA